MATLKKYSGNDCEAINKFMDREFPKKSDAIIKRSRTPDYYSWKYGPNPLGKSIFYTYWEGDILLGCFGAVPAQIMIRGTKVTGYQLTDAFVAPSMHGKGIFRCLANEVFREIEMLSPLSFGMSPSKDSLPIFTKKYQMYIGPAYRQVFSLLRFDDVLKAKNFRLVSSFGHILNVVRNSRLIRPKIDLEEINHIPPAYCVIPYDQFDFAIIRDPQYIEYRYYLCPEAYRYFKVESDKCQLVMVVKLVSWQDITICYLVDVFGKLEKGDAALFLCQAMYAIGRETSSAVVSMELHHPRKELKKLMLQGFFCHPREECVFMRQSRWPFLNPISPDYDSSKWVIYSGDSDYI